MASTSAVSMAMPPACAAQKKVAPPTSTFFQPLPLRPSNKVTVSSSPSSRLVVRASLKEKAITGLTAAALTASMMVPDVAEAAAVTPSLKNFLLSIAAGEATGDRLKEAQHINKSLSALGDVIASLAQKNPHVPYRNSKLTQLLQDSLGGQAKTLMFVHISPESDALGETISTLKFAERVATVELGAARVNKDSADVKELKEQIASLKAALARREGASEPVQHSLSGSSEKYRKKANSELSPYQTDKRGADTVVDQLGCRQPMVDVGNIELHSNSTLKPKTQNFDFDEISTNSPPWPPVSSPGLNYGEDDKETGSGEWVDKVMVNRQDVSKAERPLGRWGADNGHLSDAFYQKYLQDSSKIYTDQSYNNMFMGGNQFNAAGSDGMDDLDAATSDSSEHDLLWQFNHSKLPGIGMKSKTSVPKLTKGPELSKSIINPSLGPSPSRKQSNGVSHRSGRHPASVDMKRKTGNRK